MCEPIFFCVCRACRYRLSVKFDGQLLNCQCVLFAFLFFVKAVLRLARNPILVNTFMFIIRCFEYISMLFILILRCYKHVDVFKSTLYKSNIFASF